LIDDVCYVQKCVIARQKSLLCGTNFGGQRAVTLFLAWRLAAWRSLFECCEPLVHPAKRWVRRRPSRGHATLAMTLDRAGALRLRWRSRTRGLHSPWPSPLGGRRGPQGEP
jgi:hypothetical protein